MNYWNQANFEGLAQLAKVLREDQRCWAFADYCEQREQGLRKLAFDSLAVFLAAFNAWPVIEQRDWAVGFMEMHSAHQEVHQLISHPLHETLIAVFDQWAREDSASASPCRWLGMLTGDVTRFREALRRDSGDTYSRWRLAEDQIAFAEFACHHLPSYFIGDPLVAAEALDEAERILEPIANTPRGHSSLEELTQTRQKLNDWIAFRSTGADSFDDWCKRERGYHWTPGIAVYFRK